MPINSRNPWMASGSATATAGTPTSLTGTTSTGGNKASGVSIIAKVSNTSNVYVGGSADVNSTINDGLAPGDAIEFGPPPRQQHINLDLVYIDVDTSGEGVDFYAQTG